MADNVVMLSPRNTGRFAHTVTQDDILELLRLSEALNLARDAYLAKRDWIKAAIEAGAAIEPGIYEAWLETRSGGPVPRFSYNRLVVR